MAGQSRDDLVGDGFDIESFGQRSHTRTLSEILEGANGATVPRRRTGHAYGMICSPRGTEKSRVVVLWLIVCCTTFVARLRTSIQRQSCAPHRSNPQCYPQMLPRRASARFNLRLEIGRVSLLSDRLRLVRRM